MALYPGLSDQATIQDVSTHLHSQAMTNQPWPIQEEAKEISWLVGAPFFVQLIEGSADTIGAIMGGPLQSSEDGQRLLSERWRISVDRLADVVIATVTGDPARRTIDDLARAFFAASRVVAPGGSIVLLSDFTPVLGHGFEIFRQHDDPSLALRMLYQEKPHDLADGFMWVTAANRAKLYLLSGLSSDIAEELFTIPLQNAQQTQKLLTEQATCLLLPDAHKTLAMVR
jgi:nickel-dependent lactate racemase